jgi:hypothetical protein
METIVLKCRVCGQEFEDAGHNWDTAMERLHFAIKNHIRQEHPESYTNICRLNDVAWKAHQEIIATYGFWMSWA